MPPTVHWLEVVSALISGLGTLVLTGAAWEAGGDRRAIPMDRRVALTPVAGYAIEAGWLKAIAEMIFFGISVRAMTLGPATTTATGTPDLGAILSTAGLIGVEVILLILGLRNAQMRHAVRKLATEPYRGPDRRNDQIREGKP